MKDKSKILNFIKTYSLIILGCIVYSLGVALFLDANNLAAGGVTGIAIIINYITDWPTGVLYVIINIPLLILGAIFFGKKFLISTAFSTLLSSVLIWFFTFLFKDCFDLLPLTDNLIASLVGGALYGGGLGLIFRMGSTTAGTDIIVKILRKKFRHISSGVVSMIIDIIIVCSSAFVYQDFELICYTLISIVLFTVSFDWVLYGGNSAKLVYIVTTADKSEPICHAILIDLDSSATILDGKGAYTGSDRTIIMCAVKKILFPKLRDVVRNNDPNAFVIVSSAQEVYGEGYRENSDEDI